MKDNFDIFFRRKPALMLVALRKMSKARYGSILAKEVHLETIGGWRVYFSIDRSVESQLSDLKIVMDEQIKGGIERVDYIDLRIDNWAYYKYK